MSDRAQRDLEQRARGGDPDAGAQLLVERQRVGQVTEQGLALAAYLGHEPAQALVPSAPKGPEGVEPWVGGLAAWGEEPARDMNLIENPSWGNQVLVRATIGLARACGGANDPNGSQRLAVTEAWLMSPTPVNARVVHEAARLAPGSSLGAALAQMATLHCDHRPLVRAILAYRTAFSAVRLESSLSAGKAGLADPGWFASMAARAAAVHLGEASARDAVASELLPWALGGEDPVRRRVAERA